MSQTLWIMQGQPGSGKSTLAAAIATEHGAIICSTDDFHHDTDGVYRFKADKLAEFHKRNQERVAELLQKGKSVIVDNTNIFAWQCEPYVAAAKRLGIQIKVVRATGDFPNNHGVPADRVEKMKQDMEDLEARLLLK
jgi:predicted kinase